MLIGCDNTKKIWSLKSLILKIFCLSEYIEYSSIRIPSVTHSPVPLLTKVASQAHLSPAGHSSLSPEHSLPAVVQVVPTVPTETSDATMKVIVGLNTVSV